MVFCLPVGSTVHNSSILVSPCSTLTTLGTPAATFIVFEFLLCSSWCRCVVFASISCFRFVHLFVCLLIFYFSCQLPFSFFFWLRGFLLPSFFQVLVFFYPSAHSSLLPSFCCTFSSCACFTAAIPTHLNPLFSFLCTLCFVVSVVTRLNCCISETAPIQRREPVWPTCLKPWVSRNMV